MIDLLSLTAMAASAALLIFAFTIIRKDKNEAIKYIFAGIILVVLDFIVEYLGTSIGNWNYNVSFYFVLGLVPIELIILFFSGGVLARCIWVYANKFKSKLDLPGFNYNNILYFLILIGGLAYIRSMLLGTDVSRWAFTIPFGLWGILNIKRKNLEVSLIFAILILIGDLILETIIISQGDYQYARGFDTFTAMSYFMLSLGFFGLMEKFDKLDKFIESKVTRSLIKKSVYKRREQVKKALRKLNNKIPKL